MSVTIMMSIMKFIILAIGFGVGFWLISTAGREEKWKKILAAIFGWILIIYAIAISAMICFQWINYLSTGEMYKCPMMRQGQMQRPGMQTPQTQPRPMLEREEPEQEEAEEETEE